jgi:hypothetical protein
MPFNVRAGGAWKPASGARVRVGGAWKTVESINVRVGGAWKTAYTNTITPVITATASPNPSTFLQDVTISGTVLPAPTGGKVIIRDASLNPVGLEVDVNTTTGAYSITIPDQNVGSYTFTAIYSGYDIYQPVQKEVNVSVGVVPTTTTISRSAASYVYNETRVTLSGTVSPAPSGGTVTVSASSPSVTLGVADVDVITGAWSLLVPIRDVGTVSGVSARYNAFSNYASSTSGTTSYGITQATTTITPAVSNTSPQAGNTTTLGATLYTGSPATALSGRVVTFQGLASGVWNNLGTGTTNSFGTTTFVWTAVAGYTAIRAVYAGELNYTGVTSSSVSITVVTTISTTTTSARSVSTYAYNGTRVKITGTVSPAPSGGTITISGRIGAAGTTNFVTDVPVNTSTGAYEATMPVQDVGSYTAVIANYSGSGLYLNSSSAAAELSYTITQAATVITNTAAFDVTEGAAATLSTNLKTGGANFSGQTITFQVRNGSTLAWVNAGSDVTDANGNASISWTTNNAYDQSRAVYSGTTNYASDTSTGVAFTTRVRTTTSISTATDGSDWYWRGSIASAQQVGTNITSPAAVANAINYAVYRVDIAVSGINGNQGQAAACMWTSGNNGTLLRQGATKNLTNRADGSTNRDSWTGANFTPVAYTPGTVYKFGFWRRGNSTTYSTQWRQNNATSRNTYWDNSASAPGTFDHDTTYSGNSLDMTVYYEYYVKNN